MVAEGKRGGASHPRGPREVERTVADDRGRVRRCAAGRTFETYESHFLPAVSASGLAADVDRSADGDEARGGGGCGEARDDDGVAGDASERRDQFESGDAQFDRVPFGADDGAVELCGAGAGAGG